MINYTVESPRVEKLDEMPDYETTNGVVAFGVPVSPPTISITNSSTGLTQDIN